MYGEDWLCDAYWTTTTVTVPKATHKQIGGNHYKNYEIQPVEFAMKNNLNLCQANVVKYIVRYKDKGGREDLLKARHYIDLLLEYEYGGKASGETEDGAGKTDYRTSCGC